MKSTDLDRAPREPLQLLSVVIPARDEEGCICRHRRAPPPRTPAAAASPTKSSSSTTAARTRTWALLAGAAEPDARAATRCRTRAARLRPRRQPTASTTDRGDAVVIMMADESDDCRDVVRYWQTLNEGWDCVFGSRFIKGGGVIDYPRVKLADQPPGESLHAPALRHPAQRHHQRLQGLPPRTVIDGCRPFLAPHFNLTVELPLKAIVRGYYLDGDSDHLAQPPHGEAKLKIKEMGSRYLFICLYVWLEKYFSRGDYRRDANQPI